MARLDITDMEEKFRGAAQLIMSLFVHSPPSPFMSFHLQRIAHDLLRMAMARRFTSDTISRLEDFERSLEKRSAPILTPWRVRRKRTHSDSGSSPLQMGRKRALTAPISGEVTNIEDGVVREVQGSVRKAGVGSSDAPEILQRSFDRSLLGLKTQHEERHQKVKVDNVFYNAEDYLGVAPNTVIAQIENVWLQVDPVLDRYKAGVGSEGRPKKNGFLHEVLTSTEAGVLQISKRRIIWCVNIEDKLSSSPKEKGMKNQNEDHNKAPESTRELKRVGSYMRLQQKNTPKGKSKGAEEKDMGVLTLLFSAVAHFTWGVMGHDEEGERNGFDGNQPASLIRRPSSTTSGTSSSDGRGVEYYISVHADKVYTFYPFFDVEIDELVAAIEDLSGTQPYTEDEYLKEIFTQKLEMMRTQILMELLRDKTVSWIAHTEDLQKVLDRLTNASGGQKIKDIELIFHSCRMNPSVTTEVIRYTMEIWEQLETTDEKRLRLMTVVSRILDRAVMQPTDPNIMVLERWLREVEERLDPHSSMQLVKFAIRLQEITAQLKQQPISTLSTKQVRAEFRLAEALEAYQDSCLG